MVLAGLAMGGFLFYNYYQKIYSSGVVLSYEEKAELLIPTGSSFDDVLEEITSRQLVKDVDDLKWVAEKKKYPERIKPGRYLLEDGMSNNELINMLRSGDQSPVKLVLQGMRTPEDLAGKASRYIEADSLSLLAVLHDPKVAAEYGFNLESFRTMFLPNTYEFWWNTSASGFVERMAKEYKSFWNEERKNRASALGMSQSEVSILASIVKAECAKTDEAPKIAGVYLNRLEKRIPLQADPTLVYALGDFSITRVLDVHKEIPSPYNTYLNAGLPPGPINYPESVYLNAVLNAEEHDYFYFCAKPDFSGYHNFAKSYNQHLNNARAYQRELNKRRIYK